MLVRNLFNVLSLTLFWRLPFDASLTLFFLCFVVNPFLLPISIATLQVSSTLPPQDLNTACLDEFRAGTPAMNLGSQASSTALSLAEEEEAPTSLLAKFSRSEICLFFSHGSGHCKTLAEVHQRPCP